VGAAEEPERAPPEGGLRVVVFDDTGAGSAPWQGLLTRSWRVGSALYQRRRDACVDAAYGARSFADALAWLCSVQPTRRLGEVQFWGHGLFGRVFVGSDVLDERALGVHGAHHADLVALRGRLVGPEALVWLRTCSAFGGRRGQAFARALADVTGCRVAGHTHVIGPLQSGLHSLCPGAPPHWPVDEGVRDGDEARSALPSTWSAPHTITCLTGRIPAGW